MKSRYTRLMQLLAVLVAMSAASATALHAQTFTQLYTYSINSGGYSGILPAGLMSQGQDGNLYGTIQNNGTSNFGTAFNMTTAGKPSAFYDFCFLKGCLDGSTPNGGLTLGTDGSLYGTTVIGGTHNAGTVFRVTPSGKLTTLWSFTATGTDEAAPWNPVFEGQDRNFYGTAPGVYQGNYGVLYKVTPKRKLTVLHSFTFKDGDDPNLPTQGTDGNFYGTTLYGDPATCPGYRAGCGVVYKVTPAGKLSVLWSFKGGLNNPPDGATPVGVLTQGYDGNFYGTTFYGGTSANCSAYCGTVFKVSPSGVYKLLHSFTGDPDGAYPDTGLTLGTDGNLYGTTQRGGKSNAGAIFQITPAGKETIIYSFCSATSCADGAYPETPMMQHTDGKFYGNTSGNSLCCSVFFSLDMGLKPFAGLVNWSGKVGATAEILGQGFKGAKAVLFDGVSATFKNVSDTYLTATVPAGAKTGFVTVKTFTSTMKSNREFLVTPQIKSFSPPGAVVGKPVTITGVSLAQTTKVIIGGKAATFTVDSDSQVKATVPSGAKTGEQICITTAGGTACLGKFMVVPFIKSFKPSSGSVGTPVAIKGTSFTGTTQVTFGGVAATSFQVISDLEVDALVPTGAKTGKIQVTTPGGTATSATDFTVTQ